MVMSWQTAVGATLSSMDTLATQVLVLPFTSVTVKVTELAEAVRNVWLLLGAPGVSVEAGAQPNWPAEVPDPKR